MGFESRKDQQRQGTTTTAAAPTLAQLLPEKLPMDQLWRFTMLESWAKATTRSVMAEQI